MAIKGPMNGVTVVELGNQVAAATCTRMMADLGADVLKVENTALGDTYRVWPRAIGAPIDDDCNPIFDVLNANKRAISLDLKTAGGQQVIYKLLERADIFITNVRTKGLKHIGLDYDTLKVKFPKLVMGQQVGYGEKGPDKDKPGYDNTAFWARSGFLYGQKVDRTEDEHEAYPVYMPMGMGDAACAMSMMAGCNAALLHARETGEGDRIVIPLYGTAVWMVNIQVDGTQFGYKYPKTRESSSPFGAPYLCKDGRWFMPQVANFSKDVHKFFKCMGTEDYEQDPAYLSRPSYNDPVFNKPVMERFEKIFSAKTADEWCEEFRSYDLCFEKLYTYEEVLEDEQAVVNDYVYTMEYRNGKNYKMVRPPIRSENAGIVEIRQGPMLGEHTTAILQELGIADSEIKELLDSGAAKQHP